MHGAGGSTLAVPPVLPLPCCPSWSAMGVTPDGDGGGCPGRQRRRVGSRRAISRRSGTCRLTRGCSAPRICRRRIGCRRSSGVRRAPKCPITRSAQAGASNRAAHDRNRLYRENQLMGQTLTLTAADGHSLGAYPRGCGRRRTRRGARRHRRAAGGLRRQRPHPGGLRRLRGGRIHLHRARALRPLVAQELRAQIRGGRPRDRPPAPVRSSPGTTR